LANKKREILNISTAENRKINKKKKKMHSRGRKRDGWEYYLEGGVETDTQ
jgi:hypothetical protein